ncbi:hypothetical protein FRB91_006717 [Serendipita sp. 411]|nr:hypothetical protein FRB91_006717 [Serendipita sp. 411]
MHLGPRPYQSPMLIASALLVLAATISPVLAQNATTTIVSSVPVTTVRLTVTSASRVTVVPSTIFTATNIMSAIPTATASATALPTPVTLHTTIGPAFSVLGAFLILTGLPSAFWGHKNRWTSFFLIGFYTLAVVCLSLILRFGVLQAINPPNETLKGLFVLSCCVAGIIGGGITIFFYQGTKYFIGGWGGFAFGLFIQCFQNGGLVKPIGFRWLMYIGCSAIGFVLCTLPKLHYKVLLAATAMVGASAFILGVDCFTTAGLKEFYVYNLGFRELFPKYANIEFPVSQTMQIELGMIGAVALMGMAVQARVLVALQARLREINAEQDRRNAEIEAKSAVRLQQIDRELEEWEQDHGKRGGIRGAKIPDDLEASRTQSPESHRASSQFSIFKGTKAKDRSSVTMADAAAANSQAPKEATPASPKLNLDLGGSVERALPENMLDSTVAAGRLSDEEKQNPDIQRNIQLLDEIQGIRAAINSIKSDGPPMDVSSVAQNTRRSFTLSDPKPIEMTSTRRTVGTGPRVHLQSTPARPTSTPALSEWDEYVKNRTLFQPPSGVSQPITPVPVQINRPHSITMPAAVAQALDQRQTKERAYESGGPAAYLGAVNHPPGLGSGSRPASTHLNLNGGANTPVDDDDIPLARQRRDSAGANSMLQGSERKRATSQVIVLPPAKSSPSRTPDQPVFKSFEQLSSRHREKMRELQEPISKKESEQAQIDAARQRWERSKAIERNVMSQKEQEKGRNRNSLMPEPRTSTHSRSHSAFGIGSNTVRPSSTAKVQDWQRYQETVHVDSGNRKDGDSSPLTGSRPRSKSPLPFPGADRSTRPRSQLYGPGPMI